MPFDPIVNFIYGLVVTPPFPATSGTQMEVNMIGGADLPDPAIDGEYDLMLYPPATGALLDNAELIRVTAKTGATIDFLREQQDTTAKTIAAGWQIAMPPTALTIQQIIDAINAIIPGDGDVVGPASSVDSRPALFDGATGKLLKQAAAALGSAAFVDTSAFDPAGSAASAQAAAIAAAATDATTKANAAQAAAISAAATDATTKANSAQAAAEATAANANNLTSGTIPAARMPALTGDVTSSAGAVATTLATTAVTPGSYTAADITVDSKGRITSAANGTVPGADGWTAGEAWTYVSATSFSVASDVTAKYAKGDKIKLTQTTVKYFYLVAISAFGSGITTLTVIGGSDYTLANAAITLPFYSKEVSPNGFPQWFNYTPVFVGFSADPTNNVARFCIVGRMCTVSIVSATNGASNATTFTISLPVTAATVTNAAWCGNAGAVNNGAFVAAPIHFFVLTAGTVINARVDFAGTNWAAGNGKRITDGMVSYEI